MATIEISVDNIVSAEAAAAGGAQRIELCSGLREGGLTPSLGLLRAVRATVGLDLFVLIRPRGGDFLYSDAEFRIMLEDIRLAAAEDADGVVLGALTAEGRVDAERTSALVAAAGSMEVTFHRAFDMVRDQGEALEDVIGCGVRRVLTSGGALSAVAGAAGIAALIAQAHDRLTVLAGGGVRPANVADLAASTGAREFHSSMRYMQPSSMRFRNAEVTLGDPGTDEYAHNAVRVEDVRALVHAAEAASLPVAR